MAFAPPVVRGNFLYNGDLYVDVGNLNRHKRASVAEITQVLRPDLKHSKNIVPIKDPVGHWYEAQLIHYGLAPSKDKARAKMRLLENLNNSNLKVPDNVTAMEAEMKKDFTAAERKAKAQLKATTAADKQVQAKPAQHKKRKDLDSTSHAPTVNVNINFGTVTSPSQGDPAPAKKRKLQTARRGAIRSGPASGASQAALRQDSSNEQSVSVTSTAGDPKPRPKQTARRGGLSSSSRPAMSTPRSSNTPSGPFSTAGGDLQPSTLKKESKVNKESKSTVKEESRVKREPAVKKESKAKSKKQPDVKQEFSKQSPRTTAEPSLGLINGVYDINCPMLEENFECDNPTLILTLDTPGVWGAYDFGGFSGILHIHNRPTTASDRSLSFQWRGRENGEGEMSFGDNCNGGISFVGNGRIEGWISLYGDCDFQGIRRGGPGTPVRSAKSMRDEWEGYNEDQYERERVGRWGGGWY